MTRGRRQDGERSESPQTGGSSAAAFDRDPLADEAFHLGEAWHERRRVRADVPDLLGDAFRIARGEERPREPVLFVRAEGTRLLDLVGTTFATLKLVSPRFVETLEQDDITGWTTFPVELAVKGASGYAGLAVTGRCGAIDDTLSERITIPPPVPEGNAGPGLRGLYFRRGTWDGSDVFTSEDRASIFVTAAVKEALEEADITGAEFARLSKMERLLLDDDEEIDP